MKQDKTFTIAVYGASNGTIAPTYMAAARELGRLIGERGWCCVNGGGRTGIMGNVSDGTLDAGGRVVGVIPKFMVDKGWLYDRLTEVIITADMHQRKATMLDMSDAFVVMPGGIGTLEELFEVVTWRQLALHDKPIVLLNVNGFFDPLLEQLAKSGREGFMRDNADVPLWQVASTPDEAMALLNC